MGQLTDVQYDVVQSKLNNIVGDLLVHTPALDDLIDLRCSLLDDLLDSGISWLVEGLQPLLLNAGLQQLFVTLEFGRTALYLLWGRRAARVASLSRGRSILALLRLSWWSTLFTC
jgi:hypothetical protein